PLPPPSSPTRRSSDLGADVEVDTHIEPMEPELPFGSDAPPDRVAEIADALTRLAAETEVYDVHNVRVRNTEAGEIVNFHCRAARSEEHTSELQSLTNL